MSEIHDIIVAKIKAKARKDGYIKCPLCGKSNFSSYSYTHERGDGMKCRINCDAMDDFMHHLYDRHWEIIVETVKKHQMGVLNEMV